MRRISGTGKAVTRLAVVLVLALVTLSLSLATVSAETPVSGDITTNTTWTLAGSPYIVTDDIIVQANLTIEPGVEVKFDPDTKLQIADATHNGKLMADGTEGNEEI